VLIGFLVLVAVPLASLLIFVTVFGMLIAVVLMVSWLLLLLIAQVYAGVIFAEIALVYIFKKPLPPLVPLNVALLGLVALNIIALVPYVGLFIYLVFFLAALGALAALGYRHFLLAR